MKAFGYLIAGAALLTGASAQSLRSPAPNSSLGNGWRYKGCYSSVSLELSVRALADAFSDTLATLLNSPYALNGSFTRFTTNGGVPCTALCRTQGYKFAGTNDDQCCMSCPRSSRPWHY